MQTLIFYFIAALVIAIPGALIIKWASTFATKKKISAKHSYLASLVRTVFSLITGFVAGHLLMQLIHEKATLLEIILLSVIILGSIMLNYVLYHAIIKRAGEKDVIRKSIKALLVEISLSILIIIIIVALVIFSKAL